LLQACPKCGAANSETAAICYVCDAEFATHEETLEPEPVAVPSSEPEWRLEVAHRLEAYRARRGRSRSRDESQSALPFSNGNGAAPATTDGARLASGPRRTAPAPRRVDIEIAVVQPELDFSSAEGLTHPAALIPVADLRDRARAGWYDFLLLLLSYGAFLVLFGSLGGQFSFGKYDAVVYGITFFLFYAQYFTLFTAFNGSTPGMHLCGLRVVSFDGADPSFSQLLWRSFGYVVSAATLCLGFLWSLWDEDRLTWQDRISQTYVTHVPPPDS
jgi:uncharacterized RDD family membrane protein YckC